MKKSILSLGTVLTKQQQNQIKGGVTCTHTTADFGTISVTQDAIGHRYYVDGAFKGYLSGNIEAHAICSGAARLEREEMGG